MKEAVAEAKKFKLKINGKEREVDEKTLIAMAQKGDAADEKFRKSSENNKRIEQLLAIAKKDPDKFIKEVLGEDSVEFSKKRLARELENMSLDPKERELRDMKAKLAEYEEEKRVKAEEIQKQADAKAVEHWTKHYDTILPKAITDAGLPLTEDVIRHATDIMIANLEEGYDLGMEAVMELTKDRYLASVKRFLGSADKNKIVDLLGEDIAGKLGIVANKKPGPKPRQALQTDAEQTRRGPKSEREAMAELDKRLAEWSKQ